MGTKKNYSKNLRTKQNLYYIIPIVIAILIIPLIVRFVPISLKPEVYDIWKGTPTNADFFSYSKGIMVMMTAFLCILITFFTAGTDLQLRIKNQKNFLIAISGFIIITIISSLFSSYHFITLSGAPDRYEGIYIWISYILILIYCMNYESSSRSNRYIIYAFYTFIFLMSIIGISQFTGHDIFKTKFMAGIVIPNKYAELRESMIVKDFGHRSIYGTSYHYNFMGSLSSMMVGFCLMMSLLSKDIRLKTISIFCLLMSLFLLFGSSARSGIIGFLFILIFSVLLFSKKLLKNWKKSLIVMASGLVLLFIMGFLTNGSIFSRIPSLGKDIQSIFMPSDVNFREEIALKDIEVKDETILVNIDNLHLVYDREQDEFLGENNQKIKSQIFGNRIMLLEEPYNSYEIEMSKLKDRSIMTIRKSNINLYFDVSSEKMSYINASGKPIEVIEAEHIGFRGKEKLGSSRFYIWSRTLPLLKNAFLFGYGTDSFLAVFPQNDIYGKLYAYDDPNIIVDKPHSLYLQIAINSGIIGLVLFLYIITLYVLKVFNFYYKKDDLEESDAFAIACFMSVIGYLGAGFFNDSVLSVAPIFWVMLGLGISLVTKRKTAMKSDHE